MKLAFLATTALAALVAFIDRASHEVDTPLTPFTEVAFAIDGDTLDLDGKRVRLFGIDAPEISQEQGELARIRLMGILGSRPVTVEPIETDRYGRIVARVYDHSGQDVSRLMVARGFARAYRAYSMDYARDERDAQIERRGFWGWFGDVQDGRAARHAQN